MGSLLPPTLPPRPLPQPLFSSSSALGVSEQGKPRNNTCYGQGSISLSPSREPSRDSNNTTTSFTLTSAQPTDSALGSSYKKPPLHNG